MMKKEKYIRIIATCVCAGAIILFILTTFYRVHTGERLIGSAMELRINASEIGTGWEEKGFVYMSDPARGLEEAYEELSEKLREYGVKDGYVSVLQKRDKHLKSLVEVDIFMFNSTSGAQRFYNYTVNKEQRTSISGIREEAAVTLTETATIHLARLSNVVIEAIAWNGGGGKIVERIAGKVECRDKEMAYLEEERPKTHEPKISWTLKNSTRFGNNNAYVAGSLAPLGCTWINSREGYECTYAIVVAGETRDSKGDPIKACSAQRLEIKEQNNTGNQTMLISYDPPYLGAWPGAWHHKGYLWNYYDVYYSFYYEIASNVTRGVSNYSSFALSADELIYSFSSGYDAREDHRDPCSVVREWRYSSASDVAHFFIWFHRIKPNQTISFVVTDYLYGPPDLFKLGKPCYELPLVWEIEVSAPNDPSKLSPLEMEKYGIKKFSSEYGWGYTANLLHKLKNG